MSAMFWLGADGDPDKAPPVGYDPATDDPRRTAYAGLIKAGALPADDARRLENLPPLQ